MMESHPLPPLTPGFCFLPVLFFIFIVQDENTLKLSRYFGGDEKTATFRSSE